MSTKTLENIIAEPKAAPSELESLQLEIEKKKLRALELEILEREANAQDITERLYERQNKRDNKTALSKTNGATLLANNAIRIAAQERCNHRKGGNGADGVMGGQGDDSNYAVAKHIFENGDMKVRCLRCGKTWKHPIKKRYSTDAAYADALRIYREACNFQTRNQTSGSAMFRFSDGGEFYREFTDNVEL